ncbi:1-acyl-sn-glycerol-3-phosphate acyltransferase [Staphylococcus agnetis]|nr:1-acyl-sn-glycerol-3-phosphate acyltransferase [Staphylococcus agnetis]
MLYKVIAKALDYIIVKRLNNLEVVGLDHKPHTNRYVVTCNHESYNEIILLGLALFPNEIHYMAKQELFKTKLMNRFFTALNAFPVNRDNPGSKHVKDSGETIKCEQNSRDFPFRSPYFC